jgi:hypothetical protein
VALECVSTDVPIRARLATDTVHCCDCVQVEWRALRVLMTDCPVSGAVAHETDRLALWSMQLAVEHWAR